MFSVRISDWRPVDLFEPFRDYPQQLRNKYLVAVHVDGVRLCLWTAATNEPIVHPQVIHEYGELWCNDIDWQHVRTLRNTCPSATQSTTNPTWTDPGAHPGLRCERQVANRLGSLLEYATTILHTLFHNHKATWTYIIHAANRVSLSERRDILNY
jgi:hypothetical protein